MSLLFDGTNDDAIFDSAETGFATPTAAPTLIAFWAKAATDNDATSTTVVQWGANTTSSSGLRVFQRITNNPDNYASTVSTSTAIVPTATVSTSNWQHVIAYWVSNTERYIWINNADMGGGSGLPTQSAVSAGYDTLLIGRNGDSGSFWGGKVAHLVICENYTLTETDRANLQTKRPDHADLSALYAKAVAYYPFTADANDAKNSYDLTVTGASIDADDPVLGDASDITEEPAVGALALAGYAPTLLSSGRKLKLMAHPSAASATGVSGVVFTAPSGSDIVGTLIGEFTGAAFEATLESGQAVLKVSVVDFGGTSLLTSDTPVALARNSLFTTGIVDCTVVDS